MVDKQIQADKYEKRFNLDQNFFVTLEKDNRAYVKRVNDQSILLEINTEKIAFLFTSKMKKELSCEQTRLRI